MIERDPAVNQQFQFFNRRVVPVFLQSEAAECGLVSLSMIAAYWGHKLTPRDLRQRFNVSQKGSSLKAVLSMAEQLHLQSRPVKLEMDHLHQLKLPAIIHWDFNHFVVLKKVSRRSIEINDPASGARKYTWENFSRHFTGVAVELFPKDGFTAELTGARGSFWKLFRKARGVKTALFQVLMFGLAIQVCAMLAPFYLQWVIDESLQAYDPNLLMLLGIGFGLLVLVQTLLNALRSWATTAIGLRLNLSWLINFFDHLLKLPISYFHKRHSGDIMSRMGSVQTIQQTLTSTFVDAGVDGVLSLLTLCMMFLYSAKLAAVSLLVIALYITLRIVMFSPLMDARAEQIQYAAKQETQFLESIRGVEVIKLNGGRTHRLNSWLNSLVDQFGAEAKIARLTVSYQYVNGVLFGLERVAVIWLAAGLVMRNEFSVGMLFAYVSYKDQFAQRMAALVDKTFEFRMLYLHLERIADVMSETTEQIEFGTRADLSGCGAVELRNLHFRYSDEEPEVLSGLSLSIPAGQCIAITGPSGGGKSTLANIILGLYSATDGDVLLDGQPRAAYGLEAYRKLFGTVMQDDILFSGSVADNISFFDSDADHERIQQAAELAAIHEEIIRMPMGYQTLVGDIGSGFSGGQKQRLLFARALYKQPRLMLLDEATSNLDVSNERSVNAAVKALNMTRIIIAHRSETLAMADRVVILQNGVITHDIDQRTKSKASAT